MDANMDNNPIPATLFDWWCTLRTPATLGTTFADWEAVQYRDAWCFSRWRRSDNETYLIRGNGLTHFGRDHDTMESAYRIWPNTGARSPLKRVWCSDG